MPNEETRENKFPSIAKKSAVRTSSETIAVREEKSPKIGEDQYK